MGLTVSGCRDTNFRQLMSDWLFCVGRTHGRPVGAHVSYTSCTQVLLSYTTNNTELY